MAGNQRGGDGGVSGAGGRHLIFEARRYSDDSRLDERGILGEIEQAIDRDPALEAWLLVTTQEAPEQIQQAMTRAGEEKGIGTVIIDWLHQPLPKARCTRRSVSAVFRGRDRQRLWTIF